MRSAPFRAAVALLRALLALAALLVGLWLAASTGAGRQWLADTIGALSGGRVVVQDLRGRLPFSPVIGRLSLADASGTWLTLEHGALDLSPPALLTGTLDIDHLTVGLLRLHRLPTAGPGGGLPPRLPPSLRLRRLAIEALDLRPMLPQTPVLGVIGAVSAHRSGDLALTLDAQDSSTGDRCALSAAISDALTRVDHLTLVVEAHRGGPIAQLAEAAGVELPELTAPWRLEAEASGPRTALVVDAELVAAPHRAELAGVIDLDAWSAAGVHLSLDLPRVALTRPGMPEVAWDRLVAAAELEGPLRSPRGHADIDVEGLAIGDWWSAQTNTDLAGDRRRLTLGAVVRQIHAPVPLPPETLATPLHLDAELALDDPRLSLRIEARHALLSVQAEAGLRSGEGRADIELADVGALAAIAGLEPAWRPRGHAGIELSGGLSPARVDATAEIAFTDQPGPATGLLGDSVRLSLSLDRRDGPWRLRSAAGDARHLRVRAETAPNGLPGILWWLDLSDLGVIAAPWSGPFRAHGRLTGLPPTPFLTAELELQARHPVVGSGRVAGSLEVEPARTTGALSLGGEWLGLPLSVKLEAAPDDGGLALTLQRARWAGLSAAGRLRHGPGAALPTGEVRLTVERIADLGPVVAALRGETEPPALAGRLDARLALSAPDRLSIEATGSGLALPGWAGIESLALQADASGLWAAPSVQGRMRLEGLAAGAVDGTLTITGVDFADGLSVSRLRLALDGGGSAELAGRLAPALDLEASLQQLPMDLIEVALPALRIGGRVDADLRLRGRLDDPVIGLRATVEELRMSAGPGRSLPPARIVLQAGRAAGRSDVDARAEVGTGSQLHLRGRIGPARPLPAHVLDLRADGHIDLTDLNALLSIQGRQARGVLVLDTRIGGVLTAPRMDGSLRVADAALHDRGIGLAVTGITGRLALAENGLRIERLSGRAGRGTFSLTGRIGPPATGAPVDLRLVANDAEPLQLDRLQVRGDADLTLRGRLPQDLILAGRVDLRRLGIGLPDRLPPTVASLHVRERGKTRHPRTDSAAQSARLPPKLGLDVDISAPRAVEVRGRGVDAELGGRLRLRGTLARPEADGGFRLLRGDYGLLGHRLRFTDGRIDFDGAAGLNPLLDLEARVTAAGSTAILAVRGRATAPRIELRGEPELPQDEVLSRLLFGSAGARLSPWQVAQIGRAATALAGVGIAGPGLLGRTRERLGLARLRLGAGERGTATLEGGRYITEGVYVGARQGARAGDTQAVLRLELTPRVRVQTDIGLGGTRTGAAFELEY